MQQVKRTHPGQCGCGNHTARLNRCTLRQERLGAIERLYLITHRNQNFLQSVTFRRTRLNDADNTFHVSLSMGNAPYLSSIKLAEY